jgi:hypothetical protein
MTRFLIILISFLFTQSSYSQNLTRVKIGPKIGSSQFKLDYIDGFMPSYSFGGFIIMDRIGVELKKIRATNFKVPTTNVDRVYSSFDGTTYALTYNLYTGSKVNFSWGGGVFVEDYMYLEIPAQIQKGRIITYYLSGDILFDISNRSGFSIGTEIGQNYKSINLGYYLNL